MNECYPEVTPYDSFMLAVDPQHQLYVEQSGNPEGQPVVFLHGGPGSGCSANDRRFFDPDQYRIILFDQRGCGRSLPHGALEHNETPLLVDDIELIRVKLDIDAWHVFGGSWGSTLALVYAQAHSARVISLVLRGIFLGRPQDCHWTFTGGGATRIFPDYWHDYLAALPAGETQSGVRGAYEILTGSDREAALRLARAWSTWEMRCCTLLPNQTIVAAAMNEESCWTLARHEAHYMAHDCFLRTNQILAECWKITDIPTIIVHGRYDIVCPFDNAWLLHQQLPESELIISESSGHSSSEPGNTSHLIAATNKVLALGQR